MELITSFPKLLISRFIYEFIGSGKTSLLDIIASRSNGSVSGKVYYNNYLCTAEVIRQYAAYVMQADRLLHNLTVRETIRYAAFLRLPGRMDSTEIDAKVIIIEKRCRQCFCVYYIPYLKCLKYKYNGQVNL